MQDNTISHGVFPFIYMQNFWSTITEQNNSDLSRLFSINKKELVSKFGLNHAWKLLHSDIAFKALVTEF